MSHLIPCPSCARHVRQSEPSCPFCSSELSLGQVPPPVLPRGRLSRAATFAFGAGLVGATSLVGCSGTSEEGGGGSGNAAGQASSGNGSGGDGVSMPVYGAPAAGMAGQTVGGGAPVPVYGAPGFGGAGPSVGGSPNDGGMTSAGAGGAEEAGAGGEANAGSAGTGQAGPVYGGPPAPAQD